MFKYITNLFFGSKYKDNIKIYNANELNTTTGLEDEGMSKNKDNKGGEEQAHSRAIWKKGKVTQVL